MSRGLLGKETLTEINKLLPDLTWLQRTSVLILAPDIISWKFPPESTIPIASVCLRDAVNTLADATYALHEVFAHRKWYLEKRDPPIEDAAIHFSRYYADDVALRLYAAGEHLANAILAMLEIDRQVLKPYKVDKGSLQAAVGQYMKKQQPQHPIAELIWTLKESEEWGMTRKYRDTWVHEQPPTVEGMGIVYERRKRWERTETTIGLRGGGGDKPQYSVEEIIRFVNRALFLFADTLTAVVQFYIGTLRERGIILTNQEIGFSL